MTSLDEAPPFEACTEATLLAEQLVAARGTIHLASTRWMGRP